MTRNTIKLSAVAIILAALVYFFIYSSKPAQEVRPEIQAFLNKAYGNRFKVVTITTEYSQDLFHQPTGYALVLEDSNGIRFGNVYVQYNQTQGQWITYRGTDIEQAYREAKGRRMIK